MAESGDDLRRHGRVTMDSPVQVLWKDPSGTEMSVHGRTVDISETGLRIKVPVPIEKGVYVGFNASKVPLQGTASVRSCKRQEVGYLVGLEFSGNLRWKPKTGAGPGNK